MGGVSRFHRMLQEEVRVLRAEIETHYSEKFAETLGESRWLVRHACWLLYSYQINRDMGITAH